MKLKHRIGAILAGIALAVGGGTMTASPAEAARGNSVYNASWQYITVQYDNGATGLVTGYSKVYNVRWLYLAGGTCHLVNNVKYCQPKYSGVWMSVNQVKAFTVKRVS